MPLEVLHFSFVLFGLVKRGKRAQVATLAGLSILLSGVQAELPGFEFADHADKDAVPFR